MKYDNTQRVEGAASLLPNRLKNVLLRSQQEISSLEEIRLRREKSFSAVFSSHERVLYPEDGQDLIVSREDIERTLELATEGSMHSALSNLKNGFITVKGGHRIGICGTAVIKDGGILNMKWISSISIRIAKDYPGISNEIIRKLINGKGLPNVLIISLPGQGKTTLLRDMVRNISNGVPDAGFYGLRVSLADERGEVAAMYNGIPQFNVGDRTDVLDNVPKDQAVMMLLRSMSPQVIALDEITAPEDIKALITASYCGVRLLATAHAGETTDLKRRPLYKELLNTGIFSHAVVISVKNKKRVYNIERLTEVDTYD